MTPSSPQADVRLATYGQKGKALYDAFWARNGGEAPSWEDQARAIRSMWMNIARDAEPLYAGARRIRERNEAASRIADLEAKLATAVRALEPFGRIADWYEGMLAPDDRVVLSFIAEKPFSLTVGHCRQARTFLASIQERT